MSEMSDELRELVAKWRRKAAFREANFKKATNKCADELEAALAEKPAERPAVSGRMSIRCYYNEHQRCAGQVKFANADNTDDVYQCNCPCHAAERPQLSAAPEVESLSVKRRKSLQRGEPWPAEGADTAEQPAETHPCRPAAPPVLQAEAPRDWTTWLDDELINTEENGTNFFEHRAELMEKAFAAIRREAEQSAFEKAAQIADSHIRFYYSAANEIAAAIRALGGRKPKE
jgi:hypothetical protein